MNTASSGSSTEFDATGIISVLNRHGVRYVIIGAFAAIAQQAPIAPTRDIDLTPDDDEDNRRRLSAALKELTACVRTDSLDAGIPFDHDAASQRHAAMWNLVCRYGELDISFRPSGFEGGYMELAARAHRMLVDGVEVSVADLDDVIRSKEAAGRPKDVQVLPALYRHSRARGAADTQSGE